MWWRQKAAWKQLSETVGEILVAERARSWESSRHSKGGGGREVAESGAGRNGPRYVDTETGDAWLGE